MAIDPDAMPSLDKPEGPGGLPVTTTVKWRFPAVHQEAHKFVAIDLDDGGVHLDLGHSEHPWGVRVAGASRGLVGDWQRGGKSQRLCLYARACVRHFRRGRDDGGHRAGAGERWAGVIGRSATLDSAYRTAGIVVVTQG